MVGFLRFALLLEPGLAPKLFNEYPKIVIKLITSKIKETKHMSLKQLDVRGDICPYPMMKTVQALKKLQTDDPGLSIAKTFLNMPDLFNFFLTGIKAWI